MLQHVLPAPAARGAAITTTRRAGRLVGCALALLGWVHLTGPTGPDLREQLFGRGLRASQASLVSLDERLRRERRLRRELSNRGFRLMRRRCRGPAPPLGSYLVFDLTAGRIVVGEDPSPAASGLDAVEAWFEQRLATTNGAAAPALSAGQCREALALLGWSGTDLATQAKVAHAAIVALELGLPVPPEDAEATRQALEAAGVEFTTRPGPGPAVRLRDGNRPRSKMASHQAALAVHLAAHPGATLAELRRWMLEARGVAVSIATICKTLQRLGLSPKHGRGRATR